MKAATNTSAPRGAHISSLDGVRGIAILMVVVFHARLANYGWLGVQLFFVLSGFLITGILWKERVSANTLGFKFKKFWTRRALRIFPLYFGYLLALGVVYVLFHFPPYYLKFIPYLLTYTFNYTRTLPLWQDNPLFTQLWSLCVEEQFYIVFPFIIFLCPPRFTKIFMLSVIVLAPFIRLALTRHYLGEGVSALTAGDATCRNTLSHMDAFFLGGLIPVFRLGERVRRPTAWFFAFLAVALGAGLANFLASPRQFSYFFELGYPQFSIRNAFEMWGYTCADALFAAFILLVISRPAARLPRVLSAPWLVRIGQVSYGMYVFNLAVWMYFFDRLRVGGEQPIWFLMLLFIPYLLIVYGLAELSYRFYEVRFIRLKDRFFRSPTGPGGVGVGPSSNGPKPTPPGPAEASQLKNQA